MEKVAQDLAKTTANLDAYIERRAQEIAAPRIAAAEREACGLVAAVLYTAAFEARRSSDLVAELRKHVAALERYVERLKSAAA